MHSKEYDGSPISRCEGCDWSEECVKAYSGREEKLQAHSSPPRFGPVLGDRWDELQDATTEKCRVEEIGLIPRDALDRQIGGNHYKEFSLQPVEFITENKLGFLQGSMIKRICRYDRPGGKGLEDLQKIKHEVDLLIELEEWRLN